jgi:hypothetical protein
MDAGGSLLCVRVFASGIFLFQSTKSGSGTCPLSYSEDNEYFILGGKAAGGVMLIPIQYQVNEGRRL